jgi:hypothetical protein
VESSHAPAHQIFSGRFFGFEGTYHICMCLNRKTVENLILSKSSKTLCHHIYYFYITGQDLVDEDAFFKIMHGQVYDHDRLWIRLKPDVIQLPNI